MSRFSFLSLFLLSNLFAFFAFPTQVFSSETEGMIDSSFSFSWSENGGWMQWYIPTPYGITVTDTTLTGNIWSEHYGWITLSPVDASPGVTNDGEGHLGGYAWGEHVGYVDFSGVTITDDGYFSGYATNPMLGQINLWCENTASCGTNSFGVRTDWRRPGLRSGNPSPNSGGALALPITPVPPIPVPVKPAQRTVITEFITRTTTVPTLSFSFKSLGTATIGFSEFPDLSRSTMVKYAPTIDWNICARQEEKYSNHGTCQSGTYFLYIALYTADGQPQKLFTVKILYTKHDPQPPLQEPTIRIQKENPPATATPPGAPTFTRTLTIGSEGQDVYELQILLNTQGYIVAKTGAGSKGKETTTFGDKTRQALKQLQIREKEKIGISKATGILDETTRRYLNTITYGASSEKTSGMVFPERIALGQDHPAIKTLQTFLNTTGFVVAREGPGATGKETTTFGSKTQAALAAFQRKYTASIYTSPPQTYGTLDRATITYIQPLLH